MASQSEVVVADASAHAADELAIGDDHDDNTNDDMSEEQIERLLTNDHEETHEVHTIEDSNPGTNDDNEENDNKTDNDETAAAADSQEVAAKEVIDLDDKETDTELIELDDKQVEEVVNEVVDQSVKESNDEEIQMEVTEDDSAANQESTDKTTNNEDDVVCIGTKTDDFMEDRTPSNGPVGEGEGDVGAISDSDLIIRGLKTSLMLSEEKNQKFERDKKQLEDELKKVYQHLFKCMDEKKSLQLKCQTLEDQIDKMVANTSSNKRPAKDSPPVVRPTPPKKAPQRNANFDKKVRFRANEAERRPYFGQFGARFQENHMTPPPFPGHNAPEFMPPQMSYGPPRDPMGPFRSPSMMASPEMPDMVLTEGFQVISTVGNRLQLPASIIDKAVRLFRQCYATHLRQMCRNNIDAMATGCVYIACHEEHCPQPFKTLCMASRLERNVLEQSLDHIVQGLNLDINPGPPPVNPAEIIGELCVRAGFSRQVQTAAIQIMKKAQAFNLLPPGNPEAAAAAALLMASMASDEQKPVFEIAYLTGVNDNQIRQNYNRILPKARQLFPPNFAFITPPDALPAM